MVKALVMVVEHFCTLQFLPADQTMIVFVRFAKVVSQSDKGFVCPGFCRAAGAEECRLSRRFGLPGHLGVDLLSVEGAHVDKTKGKKTKTSVCLGGNRLLDTRFGKVECEEVR